MKIYGFLFAMFYLIYGRKIMPRLIIMLSPEIRNISQGFIVVVVTAFYFYGIAVPGISFYDFLDIFFEVIIQSIIIGGVSYFIFNFIKNTVIGNLLIISVSLLYLLTYMVVEDTIFKFVRLSYHVSFAFIGVYIANHKILHNINGMLKFSHKKMNQKETEDVLNDFGNIIKSNSEAIDNNLKSMFDNISKKLKGIDINERVHKNYVLPNKDLVKSALLSVCWNFIGSVDEKNELINYIREIYSSLGNYADESNKMVHGKDEISLLKTDFDNRYYISLRK